MLGGGLSGMVVGYELGKLGYDYQVLEARDRVGGLQWAVRRGAEHTEVGGGERQVCTFDEGQYINVGPWRIPLLPHRRCLNYCKRARACRCRCSSTNRTPTISIYEGSAGGALANKKIRLREIKADITGHINELLIKAIDQKKLDLPLTEDDQKRLTAVPRSARATSTTTPAPIARSRTAAKAIPYAAGGRCCRPVRQPAALGAGDGGHDGGADVPADRRHGPDLQGLPARDGSEAHHVQRRGAVGDQGDAGVKVTYLDTEEPEDGRGQRRLRGACLPLNLVVAASTSTCRPS